MLLPPDPQTIGPKYRDKTQEQTIYSPTTRAVAQAYAEEAMTGIGTYAADVFADQVIEAEKTGERLTKEQFDESPYLRSGMEYYPGLTAKSMELIATRKDQHSFNEEVISRASTAQGAFGFVVGLGHGTFEPKNIATGLAASVAMGPFLGVAAPAVSQLRRVTNMRRAVSPIAARAGYGASEGLIAAAIAEPSNRYSASVLQEDYTAMDSFYNVATSALFGSALHAGIPYVKERMTRSNNKIQAFETSLIEAETALQQLATGRRVDVAHVEKIMDGEIRTKPIAEKVAAAEQYVKYTETPEFKARFEGSKVVDESGAPLRVYHGTKADFEQFDAGKKISREGFWFGNADEASRFAMASRKGVGLDEYGANVRPSYLKIENPFIHDPKEHAFMKIDEIIALAKSSGNDGMIFTNQKTKTKTYVAFRPDQIISAFGADDLDAITARLDRENKAAIAKSIENDVSPLNDTAIDFEAVKALEQMEMELEARSRMTYEDAVKSYTDELNNMLEQGLIGKDEAEALQTAAESLDEAKMEDVMKATYYCLTGA